jgi:hypothetical protein
MQIGCTVRMCTIGSSLNGQKYPYIHVYIYRVLKRVTGFKGLYCSFKWSEKSQSTYVYVQKQMPAEIWASFWEVRILKRAEDPGTTVRRISAAFTLHKTYVSARLIIVITQFQVSISTNCVALTLCMDVDYLLDQKPENNLPFQCIVSILWVLIIFWCGYMKRGFTIDYLCVLVAGEAVKRRPRRMTR